MPKKQKRGEQDFDHAPTTAVNKRKSKSGTEQDDMPRSFKKIMRYQKFAQEKAQTKAKEKANPAQKKASLTIRKGESLSAFGQRVNEAVPLPLAKGVHSGKSQKTANKQRKKADNLRREHDEIKQKRGRQLNRGSDDEDEDVQWNQREGSPDPWAKVQSKNVKPKFGEVADRPPELPKLKKFTNVPKAAGSMARREMLETERSNVIEAYRKLRTKEE